jgi:Phage terminase large subunit (GpA)
MSATIESRPWKFGFLSSVKPPDRLPLSELATKNVYLSGSQYGAKYSLTVVPAHEFVLNAFKDARVKEIANIAVTGFGKTTIFEVCASYAIAQDPGDLLMLGQTNGLVKDWMTSRLLKVLRRSPWTKGFIPTGKDRNDATKMSIIFRHMAMFAGGANESNTQEKSMRYCFGDEVWKWVNGMIGELLKRHHDRLNRKCLLQSQGGNEGTEWHEFCKNGKWHNGHHQCPACKEFSPVVMDNMIYGELDPETGKRRKQRDESGEYDWPAIFDSIRYKCPVCSEEFEDTDFNRRQWSKCKPVWDGRKHFPDRVTFSWTFLTVWTKTWASVVKLWIIANDQKKRGNLEPLKQFINKDLGQFWEEPSDSPELSTAGERYAKLLYHDGEKWPGEDYRFMTIDVQKGHFWVVIRACKIGGASRLLWEGKVTTWQGLFDLQDRYGVENPDVGIDGRYMIDEVVKQVRMHCGPDIAGWWRILIGEDQAKGFRYDIGTGKRQQVVWKIFSKYQNGVTSSQQRFRTIRFSNLRAKDALVGQMGLPEGHFGIPVDVSKDYREQMAAEVRREITPGVYRWVKIKDHYDNHEWDCEVMQIVMQTIKGVIRIEITD